MPDLSLDILQHCITFLEPRDTLRAALTCKEIKATALSSLKRARIPCVLVSSGLLATRVKTTFIDKITRLQKVVLVIRPAANFRLERDLTAAYWICQRFGVTVVDIVVSREKISKSGILLSSLPTSGNLRRVCGFSERIDKLSLQRFNNLNRKHNRRHVVVRYDPVVSMSLDELPVEKALYRVPTFVDANIYKRVTGRLIADRYGDVGELDELEDIEDVMELY